MRSLACAARSSARSAQNVPAGGPPRHGPPLLPGGEDHRNASTCEKPVSVVGGGPRARPGGLQWSSLPCVVGWGFRFGPLPFCAVLMTKSAPWVRREIFSPHLISSI